MNVSHSLDAFMGRVLMRLTLRQQYVSRCWSAQYSTEPAVPVVSHVVYICHTCMVWDVGSFMSCDSQQKNTREKLFAHSD